MVFSLKSGDSAASERDNCNLETSLGPNDLSKFTSASDSIEKTGDVFSRVRLHQYGQNG